YFCANLWYAFSATSNDTPNLSLSVVASPPYSIANTARLLLVYISFSVFSDAKISSYVLSGYTNCPNNPCIFLPDIKSRLRSGSLYEASASTTSKLLKSPPHNTNPSSAKGKQLRTSSVALIP